MHYVSLSTSETRILLVGISFYGKIRYVMIHLKMVTFVFIVHNWSADNNNIQL